MKSEEKSLKSKAIKIQGKDYVLVVDRILFFNEQYPNGSITTELVSEPKAKMVVVKATVIPDVNKPERKFTGYSQAVWGEGYINKTSALENAETSAVGRALAMMGVGVIESVASADEMVKAGASKVKVGVGQSDGKPSESQLKLAKKIGLEVPEGTTKLQLSKMITNKLNYDK